MAGNVWEWVADWYDVTYYSGAPAQNPEGPDSGQYRVVRGGSWNDLQGRGTSAPPAGTGAHQPRERQPSASAAPALLDAECWVPGCWFSGFLEAGGFQRVGGYRQRIPWIDRIGLAAEIRSILPIRCSIFGHQNNSNRSAGWPPTWCESSCSYRPFSNSLNPGTRLNTSARVWRSTPRSTPATRPRGQWSGRSDLTRSNQLSARGQLVGN